MSNNDLRSSERTVKPPSDVQSSPAPSPQKRGFFSIPPLLKRIFDSFPLVTYEDNARPVRARVISDQHVLYVFATKEDARAGKPSFNPACLKWQTYLKLSAISFTTVSSTNHASPSGSLPFLVPAVSGDSTLQTTAVEPIPSHKLKRWISLQKKADVVHDPANVQCDAYAALLETCLRQAWLFQLYLSPANSPIVHRLYIEPCSSNFFAQQTILYQLRRAAELELIKATATDEIVEADIMHEAAEGIHALATLLAEDEWFFASQRPTLFDASVFAYTHLILDENIGWRDNKLGDQLRHRNNLVRHRSRILAMYF